MRRPGLPGILLLVLAASMHPGPRLWAQVAGFPKAPSPLERIAVAPDKSHFIRQATGTAFEVWGFNYDHDDAGRLLEDYWAAEWATVAEDFREMKALGANVIRVHLQTGRFMKTPDQADEGSLARLGDLVRLAEDTGLYLDLTGLGCYHKADVPGWYDALDETARWEVQARFWKAIATTCKGSPALFCYDLMNEPLVSGGDDQAQWLPGKPLAGSYFVQRITNDARGRSDKEIARAWVKTLTEAIRSVDETTMLTVGVIPWAQVFKGASPLFYAPEVCAPLDFVSVHLYPRTGKLEDDLAALQVYEVGKPLIIEEIFPLSAGVEATEIFIARSRAQAHGWISFYWGRTPEDYEQKGGMESALIGSWLRRFESLARKTGH